MATWNVTRGIRRAVWALFGLCLSISAAAAEVTKFVSSGTQAYLEVTVDGSRQKIYTEHNGDYKAMFVFGGGNEPQLIELSFRDSEKRIETWILELRAEKGKVSPGRAVASNEFIKSLKSDADGFKDWQARFSSFPDRPTKDVAITNAEYGDPVGFDIYDGNGGIVFRMSDFFCRCGGYGECLYIGEHELCFWNKMCQVALCIEDGEWSSWCHDRLEEAKHCLAQMESDPD